MDPGDDIIDVLYRCRDPSGLPEQDRQSQGSRSGNAVFAISGGSAVYASNASNASRSNFREFDNLDHHSNGIGSQGKGSAGQNLRGSQQLYQHHQYANYNNNNNSSGRLSANGGQSAYTTSNSWSPGAGNYLQQQQQQGENYQQPGQQTSRGFLGSSSSGRNQQQTLSPTSRRENLSHLDNSRWSAALTAKQHNSTPVLSRYNAASGGTGRIGYNNTPQVRRRASFTRSGSQPSSFEYKPSPIPRSASAFDYRTPPSHINHTPLSQRDNPGLRQYPSENEGHFVDNEPVYVPRSTMVDIIYRGEDELLANRHRGEELIELPSGARQRKVRGRIFEPSCSDRAAERGETEEGPGKDI